ncbi:hypothetical protein [Pseudomonas avellanae]|uniref:hypothetical protein n=1 Tax=Pseudomonas avellanae TaxID=46257 RepID=UPI0006204B8D|nr:hypothetical protein [Pseudomonas avellanae]UQW77114.1 hypothetical protein L2Y01_27605 [Pseudomonas avellanae]
MKLDKDLVREILLANEYLDAFRDGEVWRRTKAGAEKAGGAGMGLLLKLGKAYASRCAIPLA